MDPVREAYVIAYEQWVRELFSARIRELFVWVGYPMRWEERDGSTENATVAIRQEFR